MRNFQPLALLAAIATFAPSSASAVICVGVEPSPCLGRLVISELTIDGFGGASDEFVEIYNRGSFPVDASGVQVVSATASSTTLNIRATLPPATIIPPGGFYLATSTNYGGVTTPDLVGWSVGFSSDGGAVALRAGSTILDLLGWETALLFEATPLLFPYPLGGSFERKANPASTSFTMDTGGIDEHAGNGHDTDDNSLDIILRSASEPQNSANSTEGAVSIPALGEHALGVGAVVLVALSGLAPALRRRSPSSRRLNTAG